MKASDKASRSTAAKKATVRSKPSTVQPPPPAVKLYHYQAKVISVHDGDTCTVDIDLGLTTWKHGEVVRLARVNAPELTGKSARTGARSRDHLRSLIEGRKILLATIRDRREKYGRYLGEVWVDVDGKLVNVNDAMVTAGHAEYKQY